VTGSESPPPSRPVRGSASKPALAGGAREDCAPISHSRGVESHRPSRGLTLAKAWILLVPMLIVTYGLRVEIAGQDFWWHLRIGEIILSSGAIPELDLFSFTRAGETWINQAWLMQCALYLVHSTSGPAGVIALNTAIISAGYVALAAALARTHGWGAAWGGILVAFLVGAFHQGVRPQSISFLLFGLLAAAIELHRSGARWPLRSVPLLFALWGNAHGGFVFGLGALGIYACGPLVRCLRTSRTREDVAALTELAVVGIGCAIALACNPQGPIGLVRYVGGFFTADITVASSTEFQALSLRQIDGAIFGIAVALLGFALSRGTRPSLDQGLALVVFGLASLYIRRITPWFGFALAPVLAAAVSARFAGAASPRSDPSWRSVGYVMLGVGMLVLSLPWLRPYVPSSPPYLVTTSSPTAADRELCQRAPRGARVFAAQEFASFHIFHCPERPIFVDSRLELYPASVWAEYFAISQGRSDWQALLDEYSVDWLLLRAPLRASAAASKDLTDLAADSPRWQELYRDEVAVLFQRAP